MGEVPSASEAEGVADHLFFQKNHQPCFSPKKPNQSADFCSQNRRNQPCYYPCYFPCSGPVIRLFSACFPHAISEPFGSPKLPHRATRPLAAEA
jgi:hypothetical protein